MIMLAASAAVPWRSLPLGFLRPDSLRSGSLHFTPYGLSATAGLLASMALARRVAPDASLNPEAVWDAGFFAIFSCFVASRLLLIVQSPTAFLHYPLLLLGLPSLTLGGLGLAAAGTLLYLRQKRLPLRPVLDRFAAPGALFAAFLELGGWFEGSETGMPTGLPWGVSVTGAPAALRVHPVALYGVLLALLLTVGLLLGPVRAQPRLALGCIAATAAIAGGFAAFLLDMLSTPPALTTTPWLEPGQWTALSAILAGSLFWIFTPVRSVGKRAQTVEFTKPLHTEVH